MELLNYTKPEKSIRPIVNWTASPGYKLVKHLNTILNHILQLPYAFNVQNSNTLAHTLKQLQINENT
jgi:hypothetical protein